MVHCWTSSISCVTTVWLRLRKILKFEILTVAAVTRGFGGERRAGLSPAARRCRSAVPIHVYARVHGHCWLASKYT